MAWYLWLNIWFEYTYTLYVFGCIRMNSEVYTHPFTVIHTFADSTKIWASSTHKRCFLFINWEICVFPSARRARIRLRGCVRNLFPFQTQKCVMDVKGVLFLCDSTATEKGMIMVRNIKWWQCWSDNDSDFESWLWYSCLWGSAEKGRDIAVATRGAHIQVEIDQLLKSASVFQKNTVSLEFTSIKFSVRPATASPSPVWWTPRTGCDRRTTSNK